jgi:hypothetical protein
MEKRLMSDKMKPVTPSASIARPANVADHSSPALPEGSADNAGRPYQKAIDLKDLTDEERHQLTKLLEAELARL